MLPIDLRFPTIEEQRELFYPTAYVDHGGRDWNCGGITYDGHQGSDFGIGSWDGMEAGRDVVAAANGIVLDAHDGEYDRCTGESSECSGYGNYVTLRHLDGSYTMYGHLSTNTVAVSIGDFVGCGEALGVAGSSGHSTGPHLHFEVRDAGWAVVDPFVGECGADVSSWVEQEVYDGVPATTCDDVPACEPVAVVGCGDVWTGKNDDPGSSSLVAWYGCTDGTEEGAEMLFSFATDRDEPVVVTVTGLAADLDLFLMPDAACDGRACLATSKETGSADERMGFDAVANTNYTILVDGYAGAASEFTLAVACSGSLPAIQDTGDDSGKDARPPRPEREGEDVACGCATGTTAGWGATALALAWVQVARLRRCWQGTGGT